MILPIGHDQDSVRRPPWITFGIIAACISVFLLAHQEARESRETFIRSYREAVQYRRSHPRLRLDPRFERLVPR